MQVSRADVERMCWVLSGWKVEQRAVDELLAAIDAYIRGAGGPQTGVQAPCGGCLASGEGEPVSGPQTDAQDRAEPVAEPVKPKAATVRPVYAINPHERVRTCRKCHVTYEIAMFSRDRSSPGGRKSACTPCENKRKREHKAAQRAARKATQQRAA